MKAMNEVAAAIVWAAALGLSGLFILEAGRLVDEFELSKRQETKPQTPVEDKAEPLPTSEQPLILEPKVRAEAGDYDCDEGEWIQTFTFKKPVTDSQDETPEGARTLMDEITVKTCKAMKN